MIDDLGKLLDRVSAPADLAVILLIGPLGFGLDAGLDVIGFLPPSYVALGAACLGLGVKKVVDIRLAARGERKALQGSQEDLLRRSEAFMSRLYDEHAPTGLTDRMAKERGLHRSGITTDAQLEAALGECLAEYRVWMRTAVDSGVERSRG
ncbi:hypothetical protein GCM10029976_029810 [Kribbella albertanoniae]|uniref:Uncharacterized protein n=1 Tax=Kribbella albertanoniae TaxID=1266829 RepID=A0A4R4PIG0_9ACTN|nr:hypothetical protein [Kribbella albertanoniae]TDC21686.1 hypothetical protein E1261_32795 [Kribbella albertanoniae]